MDACYLLEIQILRYPTLWAYLAALEYWESEESYEYFGFDEEYGY